MPQLEFFLLWPVLMATLPWSINTTWACSQLVGGWGSANVRETVRPGAVGQCQHGGGLGALFGLLFSRGALSHLQINPTASKSCYIWEFYWSQVLFAHFSFRAKLDIYFLSWVILEPRNCFAVSCNWGLFSNGCSFVWSFSVTESPSSFELVRIVDVCGIACVRHTDV